MSVDLKLLFKALDFAAKKHRDQRRKDKDATPYINHPIELAELLVNEAGIDDTQIIIAALLHDTVEDTETTFAELEREFGKEIAGIVAEVTDDKSLPKTERKKLQIANAAKSSSKAKMVKLADKICNLRDMTAHSPVDWPLERKREYFDWAREVISQLTGTHAGLEKLFEQEYTKRP